MKKYPYQTCIRLSETLRESMEIICDKFSINESDYIRQSVIERVQVDLPKTLEDDSRKFMFV